MGQGSPGAQRATDWVYRQDPKVAARNFRGEAALIPPQDRRIHILNAVATEIWDLCRAQAQTVDELCTQLERRYEAPHDVLRRDVQELVDELVGIGALVREPRTAHT